MTEFLKCIHDIPPFSRAIISAVSLDRSNHSVRIDLVSENAFTAEDELMARGVARRFVPEEFGCDISISKLTPDEKMVARTIRRVVEKSN